MKTTINTNILESLYQFQPYRKLLGIIVMYLSHVYQKDVATKLATKPQMYFRPFDVIQCQMCDGTVMLEGRKKSELVQSLRMLLSKFTGQILLTCWTEYVMMRCMHTKQNKPGTKMSMERWRERERKRKRWVPKPLELMMYRLSAEHNTRFLFWGMMGEIDGSLKWCVKGTSHWGFSCLHLLLPLNKSLVNNFTAWLYWLALAYPCR